jgi:hypothetical protein
VDVKEFRSNWPTIEAEESDKAKRVREIAALYAAHQDVPTLGLLEAAYLDWKKP